MSMAKSGILFNGAASPAIAISMSDHTFDDQAEIGPVTANFSFGNTGILTGTVYTEGYQPSMQWLTSVSGVTAALYDLWVELVSGSTPTSGTLNTWQTLGTTRTYTNERASFGGKTSVLKVKIRLNSTSVEVANVTFILQARVRPPEVEG